jgi:hypothetical protein
MSRNTFPVPEIIYDPSLVFSPHVMLLGIIFADEAFAAPSLTSPEALSMLEIPPGQNQLPLPFKPEKYDVPIFRKAIRTPLGWTIAEKEALTYAVLYAALVILGQLTAFLHILRPYALRYGAGKAFNENGKSCLISNILIHTKFYL